MFQGFLNPNIEILGTKIIEILSDWDSYTIRRHLLNRAYQVFQMELGSFLRQTGQALLPRLVS